MSDPRDDPKVCGVCKYPSDQPRHPQCEAAIESAYQSGYDAGLDDAPLLADTWSLS